MHALLVQPRSPTTYWSYEHSLPFVGKATTLPPLGLTTLAALLPAAWSLRVRDLNVAPLQDADLDWAEVVLVSGMLVQEESIREVLRRARALGRRTVLGGPAATSSPGAFPEADHLFLGEAEGRLALLVGALEVPDPSSPRLLSPPGDDPPDLALARVPRFDLLDVDRYANQALQYSRGCPFHCEFCDIVELYGNVPRVKSPEQVEAELDAILASGARGTVFFVDDNFVGNRREVARLLPVLQAWQARHGFPFELLTEASVDLASHPALVEGMVAAGFSAVFLGIETPSGAALQAAGKTQNLRMPQERAVDLLTRAGLEVFAGFIVGFDTDGPDIFDKQLDFISNLPIPRAMVGLLTALPGTRLWRRLDAQGRLRRDAPATGDASDRPNYEPVMDERTLLLGYRRLLDGLYDADGYYRRCIAHVKQTRFRRGVTACGSAVEGAKALFRAIWGIGLRGPRRAHFWRLLFTALRRGRAAAPRAVTLAIVGESLIRYTQEVVLPRLDRAIAELPAPAPAPVPARTGA
ncbi:MAG: B12-binding domain-containing radical SAM protein [Deltaproteobacteria bacterium]|nr:B12-binding domain-containing radical SAM protein [Deltaproteobacteria bacterium]